jgi:molybdopterin converting factor small subunit
MEKTSTQTEEYNLLQLDVLLFASIKEALGGLSKVRVNLKGERSVTSLRLLLLATFPALKEVIQSCRVAVAHSLIPIEEEGTHLIRETDEVALIPPVSGG